MRIFPKKLRLGGTEAPRVPPGQFTTSKFPVMTAAGTPRISLEEWRLTVAGLVTHQVELTWQQFQDLPQVTMTADFHCVTQWSRLDNTWQGVQVREVMALAVPQPEARYVMVHCYDGYTTNLDLDALMEPESLLAHTHDGKPLEASHGAPMRLVVPERYGWKSAKWVHSLRLMERDRPGFWEVRGYHMRGDPINEERFSGD